VSAGEPDGGVALAAGLPDAAELTRLVGLVRAEGAGIDFSPPPLAAVGQLAAGFGLALPDPGLWSQVAVPDPGAVLRQLPDPADLARPLEEPIGRIKALLELGLDSDLRGVEAQVAAVQPPSQESPRAFLDSLLGPVGDLSRLLADSAFLRLVVELGRLLDLEDVERWPEHVDALGVHLRNVLEQKVGNTLLAVVGLASAATVAERSERLVAAATGWFSLDATEARFRAVLQGYGDGLDALARQLHQLDRSNPAQVAGAHRRLGATRAAFDAYVEGLTRDLAFSEASLAMVDAGALRTALEQSGETLAAIDVGQLTSLVEQVRAAAQAAAALPEGDAVDLAAFRTLVTNGLGALRDQLDRLDPGRLPELWEAYLGGLLAPLQRLRTFQQELEALVRGSYRAIHDALAAVDLAALRATVDQAMAQLEVQLGDLEGLLGRLRPAIREPLDDASAALGDVRAAILDPDTGLKGQLDGLLELAVASLEGLHLEQAVAQVQATLEPISQRLARIEFAPVVDATIEVIQTASRALRTVLPLLVTDDLRRQLAEATEVLRQVDFALLRQELLEGFDEIAAGVDDEALGTVKELYRQMVDVVGRLDPVPALEAVQREVFDPLLAEAERLDPVALLAPVQAGYEEAVESLRGLQPTEALSFLSKLFDQLIGKLPELSPARLLGPSEQAVAELRASIEGALGLDRLERLLDELLLPLTALLDSLDITRAPGLLAAGFADLRQAVAGFDPAAMVAPITAVLRQVFAATGASVDRAGVAVLLREVQERGAGLGGRLGALSQRLRSTDAELRRLDLRAAVQTLRERHDALQAALEAAGPSGLELAAEVQALDPLARLAPLVPRHQRVADAFAAAAAAVGEVTDDLAPTFGAFGAALEALGGLLAPLELLEGRVRALGERLLPAAAPGGVRDLLLGLLDALDPRQWSTELEALLQVAHAKASALLGDGVVGPLRQTLGSLRDSLGLLDLSGLTGPLEAAYAELEATVRLLDPAPLLTALDATYDRLVATLRRLDPAPFLADLDRLYAQDVVGVLRALTPEALLLPDLRTVVQRIEGVLVEVDVERLFEPVLEHLRRLRRQLDEGLTRVGGAYDGLVDLLDSAS
jgi:hypothetical protein